MAIERYNSKTDVGVKLVLVFFVCVLSFAIGTFVGKKFSDNRHRMAQFEPQSAEAGGHDVASQEEKSKSGNLSDDEIAKLAEEFVNEDETSEKSGPAVAKAEAPKKANAEHAEHAEASPAKHLPAKVAVAVKDTAAKDTAAKEAPSADHEPLKVAKEIAAGHSPAAAATAAAPGAPSARVPSSLPKEIAATPAGKFTVQVGSFPSEPEATKKVEELKKSGESAFFVEAKVKGKEGEDAKTWYRVSIGLFSSQKEADDYKKELAAKNKVTSAIVQKIAK